MSARDLVERARTTGVKILADNGELVLRGDQSAIAALVPEARAHKVELLDELTMPGVLPQDLERRIELVAKFYGFTTEQLAEAKEIAAGDIENAIPCFRALLADILVNHGTH